MDFMFKDKVGGAYQLRFSTEGLCLSPFKKYDAIVVDGKCLDWCEQGVRDANLKTIPNFDSDFKYIVNLSCWDIFTILESEFNHTDELVELCYELENGLSENKAEEKHQDGSSKGLQEADAS